MRTPKIKIELDKKRTMIFNMLFIKELEDKFGTLDEALKVFSEGKFKDICYIAYAALITEDEELTPRELLKMINFSHIGIIMEAIGKGFQELMPKEAEMKDVDPN